MISSQQLGSTVFICAPQSVLLQQLLFNLAKILGEKAAHLLSAVGATDLRTLVPSNNLDAVLGQYNKSIVRAFFLGVAVSSMSVIPAMLFELEERHS